MHVCRTCYEALMAWVPSNSIVCAVTANIVKSCSTASLCSWMWLFILWFIWPMHIPISVPAGNLNIPLIFKMAFVLGAFYTGANSSMWCGLKAVLMSWWYKIWPIFFNSDFHIRKCSDGLNVLFFLLWLRVCKNICWRNCCCKVSVFIFVVLVVCSTVCVWCSVSVKWSGHLHIYEAVFMTMTARSCLVMMRVGI